MLSDSEGISCIFNAPKNVRVRDTEYVQSVSFSLVMNTTPRAQRDLGPSLRNLGRSAPAECLGCITNTGTVKNAVQFLLLNTEENFVHANHVEMCLVYSHASKPY